MQPGDTFTVSVGLQTGGVNCKHSIRPSIGKKSCVIEGDANGLCVKPGDVLSWHGDTSALPIQVQSVDFKDSQTPCNKSHFSEGEPCTVAKPASSTVYRYQLTTQFCTQDPKMIIQDGRGNFLTSPWVIAAAAILAIAILAAKLRMRASKAT